MSDPESGRPMLKSSASSKSFIKQIIPDSHGRGEHDEVVTSSPSRRGRYVGRSIRLGYQI